MVKISIPDQAKDLDKKPILKSSTPTQTTCRMEVQEEAKSASQNAHAPVIKANRKRREISLCCILLKLAVFIVSAFILKSYCDLTEENLRLKKELRNERIKDATLKKVVADYVPEADFLSTSYSEEDIEPFAKEEDSAPATKSKWSFNVNVLWTSDDISRCDMALLSKVLAHQIYHMTEPMQNAMDAWHKKEEEAA